MRWESDEITKSLSRVVVSEGNSRVRADSFASGSHICVFRMAYAAFLFLSAAQANSTAILTARSSPSGRQRPDSTSRSTNRTAAPVRRPALCWRDCQPTWSRWQPVGLSRKSPIFGVLCLEYGAQHNIISYVPEIVNDYCVSALSPTGSQYRDHLYRSTHPSRDLLGRPLPARNSDVQPTACAARRVVVD